MASNDASHSDREVMLLRSSASPSWIRFGLFTLWCVLLFLLGLWLVGGTFTRERLTEVDNHPVEAAEHGDPLEPEPMRAGSNNGGGDVSSGEPATVHGSGVPRVRVIFGRVAYFQCQGLVPGASGRRCPRDRPLEVQVWKAIKSLESCDAVSSLEDVGGGEALVSAATGQPTRVQVRPRKVAGVEGELDVKPVLECLTEPVGAVSTQLATGRLLISFHFLLKRL